MTAANCIILMLVRRIADKIYVNGYVTYKDGIVTSTNKVGEEGVEL